jgi:outer membrane protein TolC
MEVAKKVFMHMNNKYQQGMVSSLDLTTAHNTSIQAENNFYNALLQLIQSQVALDRLLNTL